jgi:hypothetical protein
MNKVYLYSITALIILGITIATVYYVKTLPSTTQLPPAVPYEIPNPRVTILGYNETSSSSLSPTIYHIQIRMYDFYMPFAITIDIKYSPSDQYPERYESRITSDKQTEIEVYTRYAKGKVYSIEFEYVPRSSSQHDRLALWINPKF